MNSTNPITAEEVSAELPTESTPASDRLVSALQHADAFPHAVAGFQLMETHISWIILTGEFAYKIKKPVHFPFVDYSTLQRRRQFCEEEIRVNQRLAPQIYLDVVPITGSLSKPMVGGDGAPIEFAVRMREFAQSALLAAQVAGDNIDERQIDQLARVVANFHCNAARANPESPFCSPEPTISFSRDNLEYLAAHLQREPWSNRLSAIAQWTSDQSRMLRSFFQMRAQNGFIRRCHGDLHLGNIVYLDDQIQLFDAIEFNPHLGWIDCMNDTAFLLMDLKAANRPGWASRLLTLYLEQTGDYQGLQGVAFYEVYRALTRAKVALLRGLQHHIDEQTQHQECQRYIDLAHRRLANPPLKLWITHGVAASGKSTEAMKVVQSTGAVRIRSDSERLRHYRTYADRYSPQVTEVTYQRLEALARQIIGNGYPVVVDATFLDPQWRRRFQRVAQDLGADFCIIDCTASYEDLRHRIQSRRGKDASEASLEVLRAQLERYQPLTEEEAKFVVRLSQ